MSGRLRRVRRFFFTGMVVLAPVGVTAFVLVWIFRRLDEILGGPMQDALGFRVPGLGFMLLGLAVLVIGWIVHQAAGRQVLHWWNRALSRFPVTGPIYNVASQIMQTIIKQKRVFRRAVLIPYPTDGIWAVAFVTSESPLLFNEVLGEPCVNVFVPTTPNPTSGFLLIVPRARTRELNVSIEEAMKLVISAGAVQPSDEPETSFRRGLDLDHLLRTTNE